MIIYRTINYINKKIYIGQTVQKEAILNNTYKGSGKKIKAAFRKYGWNNFHTFIIVEGNFNQKLTDELETHYIQLANSRNHKIGYNIHPGGAYPLLNKKSRKKIGKKLKNRKFSAETLKKMSMSQKGRILNQETKNKISKALKGIIKSKSWRTKLSKTHLLNATNGVPVIQYDKNWNKIKEYKSISEANRALNGSGQHINTACKNYKNSAFGYKWRYKKDESSLDIGQLKNKTKYIVQINKDNKEVGRYNNLKEAALAVNGTASLVGAVCIGDRKYHKGYKWYYDK